MDTQVYFAGRLIGHGAGALISAVATDNVGSVRADISVQFGQATPLNFFPLGEEQTSTTGDRAKYATYRRDSESGLDHAWNRYYNNATARFMSPDPYAASANPQNPQSWNRYAYTLDDPIAASGLCAVFGAGSTMGDDPSSTFNQYASAFGASMAFPYSGLRLAGSLASVASQAVATHD